MSWEIEFYKKCDGSCPVAEFIDSLDKKMQVKFFRLQSLLDEYGNQLREPNSKHLEDGIFELRVIQGSNTARVLYFFVVGNKIILTNGFIKKSQKTP